MFKVTGGATVVVSVLVVFKVLVTVLTLVTVEVTVTLLLTVVVFAIVVVKVLLTVVVTVSASQPARVKIMAAAIMQANIFSMFFFIASMLRLINNFDGDIALLNPLYTYPVHFFTAAK
jgi:hypothetical protein